MPKFNNHSSDDFDLSFKVFHELMAKKVTDILLVSSPYDAFIMEEEGRLAERIIKEYRGLNLSQPPKLTWVSTVREALDILSRNHFDLVITMPRLDDRDPSILSRKIKQHSPDLPVFLLAQKTSRLFLDPKYMERSSFDNVYIWYGNTDLLLALIKNAEDRMNVDYDTHKAGVRVIILVEDSPIYYSSLLPLLYKQIVIQTHAVMEESLNSEHRIFRMRARPKILVAETYEEAEKLYRQYRPYLLSVFSDVCFPRNGEIDDQAGFALLSMIRRENPDIPLLNLSTDESNREKASKIPAIFFNKNSPSLYSEIQSFFVDHLGFGDFIFKFPDGREIARASNLRAMEEILPSIPDESVFYHAVRNHFSSWLFARSEVMLASKLKSVKATEFSSTDDIKKYLVSCIHERRKGRQRGVVIDFAPGKFDPDTDFVKVGKGSLGGKARGLAFLSALLKGNAEFHKKFPSAVVCVPRAFVISTEGFDAFVDQNNLKDLLGSDISDTRVCKIFLDAKFPDWLQRDLKLFLEQATYPLAVRSSSLLEDAQFQPFAGIYKTYMLPNNHSDGNQRLEQLIIAIKLVYASTCLETPRSYAKSTLHRIEDEKMAVLIQQLTGSEYDGYFYPTFSGVAQSYNFYPISQMKPEEGIVHIALGLGKTVMEGGKVLRFSPKYPQLLPQFSTVDDILRNAQRFFYALKMDVFPNNFGSVDDTTLGKLEIDEVLDHDPVKFLSSTYIPEDHRIRDAVMASGQPVLTFASILKYNSFPLPGIVSELLEMGRKGMGGPVEIEFAVNIPLDNRQKAEFSLLQIRPMVLVNQSMNVEINKQEISRAFCFSNHAMGNGEFQDITDIVLVNPDRFDPARTVEIASEIGRINRRLMQQNRKYLLIGPGRWGSADRWLGIPVGWNDISGVGTIIEAIHDKLQADPSQGTHFFHNITSLGISYITITGIGEDFINWEWLKSLPPKTETAFLKHLRLDTPLTIKIDGRKSRAVLMKNSFKEST
jgi:hypothetical protein